MLTAPRWPARSAKSIALALACVLVGASPAFLPGSQGFEPTHVVLLVMLAIVGLRMPLPMGLATAAAAELALALERISWAAGEGTNEDAVMAIVWTALGPLVVAACYALAEAPRRLLRATADAAVGSILQALAAKDHAVGGHSGDVADLAVAVGRRLGMAGTELAELQVAGALHDLGKLAVPQEILDKPGPLSPDEWEVIRRHPAAGEEIVPGSRRSPTWGRCCARCTSTGTAAATRTGSEGEQIPLPARIVMACDAYEAITSDRPYDASGRPRPRRTSCARARGRSSTRALSPPSCRCCASAGRRSAHRARRPWPRGPGPPPRPPRRSGAAPARRPGSARR